MRYKRVLFVIPPFIRSRRAPFTGIGCLSAFLSYHGIENEVLDMALGYSIKDFFKRIDHFNPDLLGIPMLTYKYKVTYELIKQIKNRYKIDVVVGGPHVSINRSKVLEESLADYAVKLEGEFTLNELCEGKEFDKIDGLIYRDEGKVVENQDRAFIKDLDALPFPNECFDLAICGEIIEHLPEPERLIKEVTRVLKLGGEVIITTPNAASIFRKVSYKLGLAVIKEHVHEFTLPELIFLVRSKGHNLEVNKCKLLNPNVYPLGAELFLWKFLGGFLKKIYYLVASPIERTPYLNSIVCDTIILRLRKM